MQVFFNVLPTGRRYNNIILYSGKVLMFTVEGHSVVAFDVVDSNLKAAVEKGAEQAQSPAKVREAVNKKHLLFADMSSKLCF